MNEIEYVRRFPEGFEDYLVLNRDGNKGASFEVRICSQHITRGKEDVVIKTAERLSHTLTQSETEAGLVASEKAIAEKDDAIIDLLHERGAAMSCWLMHSLVQKLQQVRLPEQHTGLRWIDRRDPARSDVLVCAEISNRVYSARVELLQTGSKQTQWSVSYYLTDNCSFRQNHRTLQSIDKKIFRDRAKAEQYLQGRQTWLERNYFATLDPAIPVEFEDAFKIEGAKIPVYTYASDNTTVDVEKGSGGK